MLALVIIIANTIIIALACIALYAIKKWKYWQEKWKNLTKLILLCLFVSFSSCSTKFTTTRTQVNFYEYPDTISWKVNGDRIFRNGKRVKTECIIDSNVVRYKIDGVLVNVKHW